MPLSLGTWSFRLFLQCLVAVLAVVGIHVLARAWTPRLGPATSRAAVALVLSLAAATTALAVTGYLGSFSLEDAAYWALAAAAAVALEAVCYFAYRAVGRTAAQAATALRKYRRPSRKAPSSEPSPKS